MIRSALAVLALPTLALAGEIVCPQTVFQHQHAAPVYAAPVLAQPYAYAPALVAPATQAGTVYGYTAEPLRANTYQIDPAQIVREAARLADGSQALARQSLEVYSRFGSDTLGIAAETEQLRARAALIEATRPGGDGLVAPIRADSRAQSITAGGATICIEPDGAGGFTIRVSPQASSIAEPPTSSSPSPPSAEPIDTPAPGDVPEGVRTLAAKCASCHTAPNAKGGLELFADSSTLNPIDSTLAKNILSQALAGTMPPTTDSAGRPLEPLSDREIATLRLLLERP
jgi:hypothetical protein